MIYTVFILFDKNNTEIEDYCFKGGKIDQLYLREILKAKLNTEILIIKYIYE